MTLERFDNLMVPWNAKHLLPITSDETLQVTRTTLSTCNKNETNLDITFHV